MPTSKKYSTPRTSGYAIAPVFVNGGLRVMMRPAVTWRKWLHRRAMQAAGIKPEEIGLLVVGTTTPDLVFPSTACLLQARLGLPDCGAMDVNAACSGFMYALSIADKYIRCGEVKTALVIGVDKLTAMIDWNDRGTAVLFGDGAGAVVLEASDEAGILSTHIHAAGRHSDLLGVDVGVSTGFKAEERGGVRIQDEGQRGVQGCGKNLGPHCG